MFIDLNALKTSPIVAGLKKPLSMEKPSPRERKSFMFKQMAALQPRFQFSWTMLDQSNISCHINGPAVATSFSIKPFRLVFGLQ
jgi:hypothetical protein